MTDADTYVAAVVAAVVLRTARQEPSARLSGPITQHTIINIKDQY